MEKKMIKLHWIGYKYYLDIYLVIIKLEEFEN